MAAFLRRTWEEINDVYERSRLLLAVLAAVLVFSLSLAQNGRRLEAVALSLTLPALAAFNALRARNADASGPGLALWIVVLGFISSELLVGSTLFESAPLASARLSAENRQVELQVRSGDLEVETVGSLGHSGTGEGHYSYELRRGGEHVTLSGDFSQTSSKARRRSRLLPTSLVGHTYDTEREFISLAGDGPITATFGGVQGGIGKTIEVRLLSPPPAARWVRWLLWICVAATVLIDARGRQRRNIKAASWIAASAVFALNLVRHYSVNDPMGATIGSLVLAIGAAFAAAGLVWLLARVLPAAADEVAVR